MPRPRRIFRPAGLVPPRRGLLRRVFALAGLVAAVAIAALNLPSDLLSPRPAPTGAVSAEPTQVRVVDGDTLRIGETTVRLLGLDAPERGETCRRPDGSAFDCGAAATDQLARLVREKPVACRLRGTDRYGRSLAVCEAGGTELNSALVSAGFAISRGDLAPLSALEAEARAARRGLWAMGADAPEGWRRGH